MLIDVPGSSPKALTCRFCLADEPSDAKETGILIAPCDCKALVHPSCLKRWQGRQVALAHGENASSSGFRRCEVCHAAWTVELITDADRLLKASCWVKCLDYSFYSASVMTKLAANPGHEFWELLVPGTLIVQTPRRAARTSAQMNHASRAQAGDPRALSTFLTSGSRNGAAAPAAVEGSRASVRSGSTAAS